MGEWGEGVGPLCIYWDGGACKLCDLWRRLSFPLTESPLHFLSAPPPPAAVLPPGRVGQHGALDALLRRLLGHLAHLPHRS